MNTHLTTPSGEKFKLKRKRFFSLVPQLLSLSIASALSCSVAAGSKMVDLDNVKNTSWAKAGKSLGEMGNHTAIQRPSSAKTDVDKDGVHTSEYGQIPIDDRFDTRPLGSGYDSVKEEFKGATTVYVSAYPTVPNGTNDATYNVDNNGDGFVDTATFTGNTESYFYVGVDQSLSSIISNISGEADADLKFASVDVQANVSLGLANAADEYSSTYTLFARVKPRKPVLLAREPQAGDPNSGEYLEKSVGRGYNLSPSLGMDYRTNQGHRGDALRNYTGNEFIQSVELGAWLMLVLKFQYRNTSDKLNIGGKVAIDYLKGKVEVDGSADYSNVNNAETVSVSIWGHQVGGDTSQVTAIIPNEGKHCTFKFPAECFAAFENAVKYMRGEHPTATGFSEQFTDASGNYRYEQFSPVAYRTARYDKTSPEFADLMQNPEDKLTFASRQALRQIHQRWEKSKLHFQRADFIQRERSAELSSAHMAQVIDIKGRADRNAVDLQIKIDDCLTGAPGDCVTIWSDKSFLESYDETALEF